jgi:hypothetical protein
VEKISETCVNLFEGKYLGPMRFSDFEKEFMATVMGM